jgi:hypothetical protein
MISRRFHMEITSERKKRVAFGLFQLLENAINETQRTILDDLERHKVETNLKIRVINAWMKTRIGKILRAFELWKRLPSKRVLKKKESSANFVAIFEEMLRLRRKQAFDELKELWYESREIKRKVIRQMMQVTSNQRKNSIDKWRHNARVETHLLKCRDLIHLFENMNTALKSNLSVLTFFDINRERKEKVIRQLMTTRKIFMKFGFDKWRRYNEHQNVQLMMHNQKREFMLNRLDRYAQKGLHIRKIEGFKGFQIWRQEVNLKIKVIKQLFNTRAGKLANAFDVWKRTPTKKELKRLNTIADLDAALRKFEIKRKMNGFDELKKLWYQARESKKACIKKWIYLSINKKKKVFLQWAQNAEKIRTIQNCRNITSLFEILSSAVKDNTNLLYDKGYDSERKMDIVRKIVANSHSKRVQFFNLWHKFTIESRFNEHIEERNKNLASDKIFLLLSKIVESTKKQTLDSMSDYSQVMAGKKKIILALKKTTFYRMAQSFRKWKSTSDHIKMVKGNSSKTLEFRLKNLLKITMKWGLDAIKTKYIKDKNHAINTSKRIILMFLAKQRKAISKWRNVIEQTKKENRLKDAQNLFEVMKESLRYSSVEIYDREINFQQKKDASKLFSILVRAFNIRLKTDLDNIERYRDYVVSTKLRVFKALDQNSSSRARDSLIFWKTFTKKSIEASNIRNTLMLFGILESSLRNSTDELYEYTTIDYGKKMVLKQLYHNWSTRKSALFNRWKENVNKQKMLEKALTFGKIIITCRKNRDYVLKEAVRFWKRNTELINFKNQTAKMVKTKDMETRVIAGASRIMIASSKLQLRCFKAIHIFTLRRNLISLVFSKLEERHIYLKNTGFERIKETNKQKYSLKLTKSIMNGSIVLDKYSSKLALFAFEKMKELKNTDKKIWRLSDIFRKGLLASFNKWRFSAKTAIISRMSNYCVELQEEVKERHKQVAHLENTMVRSNALSILFLTLEKALNGSATVGVDVLRENKHDWDKKAIYLNRMEQVAKFKKSYVFEIWKSMCTEKLLKSFYDTILLEKSLMKYVSNLKFFAFHRIRTSGILEYWRTYNNALWKWKLSNVEARYYTQQNTFLKQAKSVSIMKLIIEGSQRNVLRDAFGTISTYKVRNNKEVNISFNAIDRIYKSKLADYFNQIRLANTINAYEEDIKMNKLAAGLSKLGSLFSKDSLKDRSNLLTNLQQTIYQRSKIQRMTTILERFGFNQTYHAFHKLKNSTLYVGRKSHIDLKTQTIVKCLELYQQRLARSGISKIKNYLLMNRKLISIRNSLSHILAKCKGRGILRKWLVKSRLRDQIKATKFVKMISLIGKNREHILRRALRKWSFKRGKNVLDIFTLVLKRYLHFTYKIVFDKIKQKVEMYKYLNKVLATQKIMRFKRLFIEYRTFVAFKTWYDRTKNYNPWFKRSVAIIAKNSKINYQIAFWRLKDAVKVEGSNLTASKVVKCKKIINFVKKLYEMNIAKAFWMIERRGHNDNSFDRPVSARKLRNGDTPEKKREERDDAAKKKVIKSILGRVIKKYGPTRQNILSGAFSKWGMKAGIGKKVVMQKLQESMQEYEMDYVAKYGAMHILVNTIKNLANKQLKHSFEKITNFNSTVIYLDTN